MREVSNIRGDNQTPRKLSYPMPLRGAFLKKTFLFFSLGYMFFLPLYEAPKNLFALATVFVASMILIIKGKPTPSDKIRNLTLVGFALVALSGLFAGLSADDSNWERILRANFYWISSVLVAVSFVVVGLCEREVKFLLVACVTGAICTIVKDMDNLATNIQSLGSLGFISHASLFVAGLLIVGVNTLTKKASRVEYFVAYSFWGLSFLYFSEQSVFETLLVVLICIIIWFVTVIKSLLRPITAVLVGFGGLLVLADSQNIFVAILDRINTFTDIGSTFWLERLQLRTLEDRFSNFTMLGVGISQYNLFASSSFSEATESLSVDFIHPRSLYSAIIFERGLTGTFLFGGGLFLLIVLLSVQMREDEFRRRLSISTLGLLFVMLALGLIQTTFHLEHGALVFSVIAMCLGLPSVEAKHNKPSLMIYTFGPPSVPSVRFRISQYLPLLEQSFDVTVSSDKPRLRHVLWNDFDICFFQKRMLPLHVLIVGFLFKKAKWVFDYDDMVWMPSEGAWGRYSTIRTRLRFLGATFFSDLVTTSSRFLARFSTARNTVVLPVSSSPTQFSDVEEFKKKWRSDPIIFGWAGKAQSRYQLEYLLKVRRITGLSKTNFVILSGEPPSLDVEYEYLPFTEENEKKFFSRVHVGLVPSTDRPFDYGKTPVKALQHFSYGGTVLADPRGASREAITANVALCGDNFEELVQRALADKAGLAQLAETALDLHRNRFSSAVNGGRFLQILEDLIQEKNR